MEIEMELHKEKADILDESIDQNNTETILDRIIAKRKQKIKEKGFSFGHDIPEKRERALVPFVSKKTVILEIKKASPSKGWIQKKLNIEKTVFSYVKAGANAISVLTEEDFFKGSINDLISVTKAIGQKQIAVLRKDFLTELEDVEISYRIGADALLLIASVLDFEKSKLMIQKTIGFGMSVLYEVRSIKEFDQYQALADFFSKTRKDFFDKVILGVNARDLKTFKIDPLIPVHFLSKIYQGINSKIVYESGIKSKEMAEQLASLGFYGLLIGEGAVNNRTIEKLVGSFIKTKAGTNFWKDYVALLDNKTVDNKTEENKPVNQKKLLKKICGFTRHEDLIFAKETGVDMVGFIFSNKSKRNATTQLVKDYSEKQNEKKTIRVGVITDLYSKKSRTAQRLIKKGLLDVLQLHDFNSFHNGEKAIKKILKKMRSKKIAYYCAITLSSEKDIATYMQLKNLGEFRILLDVPKTNEGTVSKNLLERIDAPLWLAGGINPENAKEFIDTFDIELLDFARATESTQIGIKDFKKIEQVLEI